MRVAGHILDISKDAVIYYNYYFLILEKSTDKPELVILHGVVSLQCSVMMGDNNYNTDYCGSKIQY